MYSFELCAIQCFAILNRQTLRYKYLLYILSTVKAYTVTKYYKVELYIKTFFLK